MVDHRELATGPRAVVLDALQAAQRILEHDDLLLALLRGHGAHQEGIHVDPGNEVRSYAGGVLDHGVELVDGVIGPREVDAELE